MIIYLLIDECSSTFHAFKHLQDAKEDALHFAQEYQNVNPNFLKFEHDPDEEEFNDAVFLLSRLIKNQEDEWIKDDHFIYISEIELNE